MTYKLTFLKSAKKEWDKLYSSIKTQLKDKLAERLINPCVLKDKLCGTSNLYKIKLRSSGYRLVYHVCNKTIVVQVIAIGKRERSEAYNIAFKRFEQSN